MDTERFPGPTKAIWVNLANSRQCDLSNRGWGVFSVYISVLGTPTLHHVSGTVASPLPLNVTEQKQRGSGSLEDVRASPLIKAVALPLIRLTLLFSYSTPKMYSTSIRIFFINNIIINYCVRNVGLTLRKISQLRIIQNPLCTRCSWHLHAYNVGML